MRIIVASAALALGTGCGHCLPAHEFSVLREELREGNVRRAQAPMRAAAARVRAELLPSRPRKISEPGVRVSAIMPEGGDRRAEASCVRQPTTAAFIASWTMREGAGLRVEQVEVPIEVDSLARRCERTLL